eukprot:CAMPEP_0171183932 /NCGR_PEP_ID=MMETSP0790-20130122/15532_1 /TAXON_ID=2925 /ORGANISM="Alexandrium catenella, Strain OF101" /LENGTH=323 /DNA_ID=CAMNT_0011648921 /DNA_START=42 /DNA_END=1009 /DNA_ORIENTATION=+
MARAHSPSDESAELVAPDDTAADDTKAVAKPQWFTSGARIAVAALLGIALVGAAIVGGARLRQAPEAAAAGGLVALDETQVALAKWSDAQATLANCVIDADQAAFYLIQAVNFIRFSTENCRVMVERVDRMACAASVTTVIASFGWTASYVSAAINSCGTETNVPAACAASMSGFVACLGEFGFVASAVVEACDSIPLLPPPVDPTAPPDPLRGWAVSQCIVDLNVGITYVGRVGIQIYFLTTECPQTGNNYDRKKCALDIFNVISSMAWAAQFLANAAVDCPEVGSDPGAACAGVISDFVATVAALGPLVNGISDDCQPILG